MNGKLAMLEARRVSFDYRRPVLRDISLALKPGTVTGIIGPNGSGKPPLCVCWTGLASVSGEVLLGGTQPLSR